MTKPYIPTMNDVSVLSTLSEQSGSVTVREINATGMCGEAKDTQYSVTKLTNAGFIRTTGQRVQVNEDGTPKKGRPSRLIAITDEGREELARCLNIE